MKIYEIVGQGFLVLALLSFLGWIYARFQGAIVGVSHEGFLLLTTTALMFVISTSLIQLGLTNKK